MTVVATLCHILHDRRLLLKKANRGISRGKWNGLGGRLERGETLAQNVVREVLEETSIRIINPAYHGKIGFSMNGGASLDWSTSSWPETSPEDRNPAGRGR